jgi:hypothetical protein
MRRCFCTAKIYPKPCNVAVGPGRALLNRVPPSLFLIRWSQILWTVSGTHCPCQHDMHHHFKCSETRILGFNCRRVCGGEWSLGLLSEREEDDDAKLTSAKLATKISPLPPPSSSPPPLQYSEHRDNIPQY